jgi:hypothetical protein
MSVLRGGMTSNADIMVEKYKYEINNKPSHYIN